MTNNFLLQKTTCICEQITSMNMRACGICGHTKYEPEIQAKPDARKRKAEQQRQEVKKKYGNKPPF